MTKSLLRPLKPKVFGDGDFCGCLTFDVAVRKKCSKNNFLLVISEPKWNCAQKLSCHPRICYPLNCFCILKHQHKTEREIEREREWTWWKDQMRSHAMVHVMAPVLKPVSTGFGVNSD